MAVKYGAYGGRYVPETLIPALDELEAGWHDAQADASFATELDELSRDLRGPPHPAHARRAVRARQAAVSQA